MHHAAAQHVTSRRTSDVHLSSLSAARWSLGGVDTSLFKLAKAARRMKRASGKKSCEPLTMPVP